MKIVRIQVQKLFNLFNHDIQLNEADHITILHGLNGYGKTTLLRMLDSLFNGSPHVLFQVPFDALLISFDDDSALEVTQARRRNSKEVKGKDKNEQATGEILKLCRLQGGRLLRKVSLMGTP